ncbi:hypothetical protein AYI68_g6243 [Smittium mucronatum]|uniref:Uncharacterized protein n=1 Tax=Smittium mucronatum TaxID=133383 RepID=A0A1R0GS22_9FUNG|nr:hypothetical protein AYI68_g6243 [Smittium mucronatum]
MLKNIKERNGFIENIITLNTILSYERCTSITLTQQRLQGRCNTLTPPIYTLPVIICTDNTKCLYSPHGRKVGEKFTWGLESTIKERPIKLDTNSYITASPAKLTDGSKSSPSAKTS